MTPAEDSRVGEMTRTGLGWLIGARLLLAGLSLGLAVILDRLDGGHGNPGILGVYWTVVAAFTATIVSALMVSRTPNPERFAMLQVGIDVTIVTSLVYFSGAGESVFTFLYALVVLYGALVLDRRGVGLSVGLAAFGYGLVLFGSELGILPTLGLEPRSHSLPVLGAYWGFYAGALLVLGMLANTLSAELRRTGAALDRRTYDLRRLRDLHLRTVESIGSGLVTTDVAGRITSFNPEAERITGVCSAKAVGRSLEELIPGATQVVDDAIRGRIGRRISGRDRIPYRNLRDEALFLGLGASSLRDEAGEQLGQVVIFQDVSNVVAMEQELRQSERLAAVGEMAARIAHEIRNPLASISGSVQILQSSCSAPSSAASEESEREQLMGIVVREVDRLNDLIGDFLLYSRPAPLRTEEVDLSSLVEEIAKMSEGQTPAEIRIALELDHDVRVIADPAQLKAVIWNLWNNAIQAMGDTGYLVARVRRLATSTDSHPGPSKSAAQDPRAGDRNESCDDDDGTSADWVALLEIEDSGMGITPDVQEMIFEPFFTTKREGTGLGLATVQRIIEQHGGSIEVKTEIGEGTCFRVLMRGAESSR